MPRFPVSRSQRVPGFVGTPSRSSIDGTPELNAIGDAIAGFAQGIAPGVGRAVAERRQAEENMRNERIAFQQMRANLDYEAQSEMAMREIAESTDDPEEFNKQWTEAQQGIYDETYGRLSEEAMEKANPGMEKNLRHAANTATITSTAMGKARTFKLLDAQLNQVWVPQIFSKPESILEVLADIEDAVVPLDDTNMGLAVRNWQSKTLTPAVIESAIKAIPEISDPNTIDETVTNIERAINERPIDTDQKIYYLDKIKSMAYQARANAVASEITNLNQTAKALSTGVLEVTEVPDISRLERHANALPKGDPLKAEAQAAVVNMKREIEISKNVNEIRDNDASELEYRSVTSPEGTSPEEALQEGGRANRWNKAVEKQIELRVSAPVEDAWIANPNLSQSWAAGIKNGDLTDYFSRITATRDRRSEGLVTRSGKTVDRNTLIPASSVTDMVELLNSPDQGAASQQIKQFMDAVPNAYSKQVSAQLFAADKRFAQVLAKSESAQVASTAGPVQQLRVSEDGRKQIKAGLEIKGTTETEVYSLAAKSLSNKIGASYNGQDPAIGASQQQIADAAMARLLAGSEEDVSALVDEATDQYMANRVISGSLIMTRDRVARNPTMGEPHIGNKVIPYAGRNALSDFVMSAVGRGMISVGQPAGLQAEDVLNGATLVPVDAGNDSVMFVIEGTGVVVKTIAGDPFTVPDSVWSTRPSNFWNTAPATATSRQTGDPLLDMDVYDVFSDEWPEMDAYVNTYFDMNEDRLNKANYARARSMMSGN